MGDWSLIGVRFALYVTLAALFGLAAFSLYGLRARERGDALALRPWFIASAGLSLLFSGAWVVLMASSMAGTPAWPIDREAVGALLTGSATERDCADEITHGQYGGERRHHGIAPAFFSESLMRITVPSKPKVLRMLLFRKRR